MWSMARDKKKKIKNNLKQFINYNKKCVNNTIENISIIVNNILIKNPTFISNALIDINK